MKCSYERTSKAIIISPESEAPALAKLLQICKKIVSYHFLVSKQQFERLLDTSPAGIQPNGFVNCRSLYGRLIGGIAILLQQCYGKIVEY